MNRWRWLVALLILAFLGAWFAFDLGRYFDLAHIKQQQQTLQSWYADYPWRAALIFFSLYVLFTTTSVPGGAVMSVIAGAIFGSAVGALLVSFASSIGATLAFLASRFLFRDMVRRHFGERLRAFDAGMARDGAFYLFSLRLVPVFPFFFVNFLMGLTPIRTFTYYWVSQAGMLAGTLIYVNAGTQLAGIESARDILSPGLVLSLLLLGLFPLIAKKAVDMVRGRRSARFNRNFAAIDGRSGRSARAGRRLRASRQHRRRERRRADHRTRAGDAARYRPGNTRFISIPLWRKATSSSLETGGVNHAFERIDRPAGFHAWQV